MENHWPKPIQTKFEFAADPPPRRQRPPREHQEFAAALMRRPEFLGIRPSGKFSLELQKREIDFLENMMRAATCSAGQWKWLTDIQSRQKAAA